MSVRRYVLVPALLAGLFAADLHAESYFVANLSGAEEVPPAATTAVGFARVALNEQEAQIRVTVSFSGLSTNATASHIHTGAVGMNGGVTFGFVGVPAAMSGTVLNQTFAVSAAQVALLKTGGFYVNVHTTTFGGGEIRGQLYPDKPFTAVLDPSQEVPPTASTALGTGAASLNDAGDTLITSIVFTGLTGAATAAHIHTGAVGASGGVTFNFGAPPAATAGAIGDLVFAVTAPQAAAIRAGGTYFNVHTGMFGGGEIRGQLMPTPRTTTFSAVLSNAQEVTPNTSTATAFGILELLPADNAFRISVNFTGLTGNPTAAHIHTAGPGINGPVTFPFAGLPAATAGVIPSQLFPITPTQLAELRAGHMYFNIHTTASPGGEIRGQIYPTQSYIGMWDPSQEVPVSVASTALGIGNALISPAGDQIGGTMAFSGLAAAVTAAHIHTGAIGINGGVTFNFAPAATGTAGGASQLFFPATSIQLDALRNRGMYFNVHDATFPGGEIRGQILQPDDIFPQGFE